MTSELETELIVCECDVCLKDEGGPCRYLLINTLSRQVGECFSCRKGVHSGTMPPRG